MKPLVVITGASSGIGAACAQCFSAQGHPLLLLGRRLEPMQALNLPDTLCKSVDVRDRAAFEAAIGEAEKMYGGVDGIILSAGRMLLGDITKQDPQEWQSMVELNVVALLNNMQVVLPGMIERKRGTVITLSSIAGRKTFPNHAAYVGTKFAVTGMSENIREEVSQHGVKVCTIEPGAVETELLSHTSDKGIKNDYEAWKTEMGGVLRPEDIANAAWYIYEQPQNVCVRELVIAATAQQP